MNNTAVKQLAQVSENGNATCLFFSCLPLLHARDKNCRKRTMETRTKVTVKQLAQVSENGSVAFCFFRVCRRYMCGKKDGRAAQYQHKNKTNGSGRKYARKLQFK